MRHSGAERREDAMKHDLKRYLPLLFALPPVALGAVMPWLSAAFQDARMGNSQESLS